MKVAGQFHFSPLRILVLNLLVAVALSTQLGGGCATTTTENDRYDDRYEQDQNRIPSNARLMSEGEGRIGFRAASTGRVWVYDLKDRKTQYTTDLLDGDNFSVDPADDRVYLNDKSRKVDLKRDHVHRLYFDGRRGSSNQNERPRPEPTKPDEPKRPVPDAAKMVAETARGGELSYKAPGNGKAYLYDNSNNVLVETFNVKKGQRLTINVTNGLGTIDGKQVFKKALSQKATYRLLFEE
jgi:hypothetical protein